MDGAILDAYADLNNDEQLYISSKKTILPDTEKYNASKVALTDVVKSLKEFQDALLGFTNMLRKTRGELSIEKEIPNSLN